MAPPHQRGKCHAFEATGTCAYGDKCKFSHGGNESIPDSAGPPSAAGTGTGEPAKEPKKHVSRGPPPGTQRLFISGLVQCEQGARVKRELMGRLVSVPGRPVGAHCDICAHMHMHIPPFTRAGEASAASLSLTCLPPPDGWTTVCSQARNEQQRPHPRVRLHHSAVSGDGRSRFGGAERGRGLRAKS